MPRVLRIINRLNLGGPTYNAAYLTHYLAPEYETMLISGMRDSTEESSEFIVKRLGIEPVYIPEMKREIDPVNDRAAYARIKKIIKEFKPDIVHTHASKAGTIGRIAAFTSAVPVIVHTFHGHAFHSYFNPVTSRIFLEIEKYLAKRSNAIVAISEIQKRELVYDHKIAPAEKVKVIPLGFDLMRFRQNSEENRKLFREQYHLADDEVAVGLIGRLVPIKNHDLFINSFKNIKEKTTCKVKAFLIGDGQNRIHLEKLVGELQLQDDVIFTSWIKDVEVPMAGLDIIALTSLNEGTPVSLIEAQAAGKPVVSTDVGGVGNVVMNGVTGFLSPSDDVPTFTANLLQLIQSERLRQKMGMKGWDFIKDRYHFRRLVSDTARLYEQLLREKKEQQMIANIK